MNTPTSIGCALLAASCVSVLSGCGSSGSPAGDKPPSPTGTSRSASLSTARAIGRKVDPCTVLTTAEVHSVLGGTVSVKRDNFGPNRPGCDFNVAGSVLGNYASVVVIGDAGYPNVGTVVPGVGDRSSYDDDKTVGQPIIYVTKGSASVDITYGSDTQVSADKQQFTIKFPADIKPLTIALGKDAAAHL